MGRSYRDKARDRKKPNRKGGKGSKDKEEKSSSIIPPLVVLVLAISLIGGGIYLYLADDDQPNTYTPDEDENKDPEPDSLGSHLTARFETLNGQSATLEQYLGKVVIVDMFATWCGPCETQIEELKKVDSYYDPSDVIILSVDTDYTRENAQMVSGFQDDHNADWTFAMSTSEFNGEFPASAIPTLFIIDRDGDIVYEHQGVETGESLIQILSAHV